VPAVPVAASGSAVAEDVDRAAARGHRRRRDDREEDGVLVVLAHGDDPHLHVVLTHQPRQHALEADLQPFLPDLGLLAQCAERPLLRGGGQRGEGGDDEGRRDEAGEAGHGEGGAGGRRHVGLRHIAARPGARQVGGLSR
jgi:hypothetical protein